MIPKQDRQGVRQAKEIEQKYDLGEKDYSAVIQIANNAQKTAEIAKSAVAGAVQTANKASSDVAAVQKSVSENAEDIKALQEEIKDIEGGDGYSPTAKVVKSGKVATITITDKDGTTTATVSDGADGYTPQKGVDYFDGKDGYTPVKGVDYTDGKDGYTPVKGKDYFDGEDGYTPVKDKDYFDGEDGKSAYQYAKEGGYDGSEAEFTEALGNIGEGGGGGNSNITFATEEPTEEDGADGELRLVPVVETIEHSRLPKGYTELEHIESTGTQYIDTGFVPDGNTRVIMDVQLTSIGSVENSSNAVFFGSRATVSSQNYSMMCAAGALRTGYNKTNESPFSIDPLTRVTIDKDGETTTINGETHSFTAATFEAPGNMYLLALNQKGTLRWLASAKLYSCQVYDNGTLVRDYVPCINPSGVVGLYDMANGVFYADAAGGAFIAGSEAELETEEVRSGEGYFKVDGKWYKLLPTALTAAEIRAICT